MHSIYDLRFSITPKSDQINSEQLLSGPMTITVTDVTISNDEQQPLVIHHDKDPKRPYKPCKTMRKVLVLLWGEDGTKWIGQSMTLFCDQTVRFGGAEVGGIRISHMTGIESASKLSLTATRGKKADHNILPLVIVPAELMSHAKAAAAEGTAALESMWKSLPKDDKVALMQSMAGLKRTAKEADAASAPAAEQVDQETRETAA